MRHILFILALLSTCPLFAESNDSCYVYKMAQVDMDFKGFFLVEKTGAEMKAKAVTNQKDEILRFTNWVAALNYLSREGWELVDVSFPSVVKIWDNVNVQAFILRKKMSIEEAKQFSTPLNPE